MENLRLSAVADRVVAWHNRHPLARRISAAQVHAIGYVALPFAAEAPPPASPSAAETAAQAIAAAAATPLPVLTEVAQAAAAETPNPTEGSRLRERALARARELGPEGLAAQAEENAAALLATLAPATLKADFSENFIDPLRPRQVARFALKHGRVLARAPLDGPVREVRADGAHRGRVPVRLYLLTAVIETDTRKSRVLLGLGSVVLGRRIHSSPRLAALAALGAGLVGTPLWLLRPVAPATVLGVAAPAAGNAAEHAAGPAASAAAPASAAAAAHGAETAGPPLPAAAHAPPTAASAPAPEALPAPLPPEAAAPPREPEPEHEQRHRAVNIVPALSEEDKARAREQRRALMEAAAPAPSAPAAPATTAAPAPAAAPPPAPVAAAAPPAAPARPALAVPSSGPVFAISTRPLRTKTEAEQVRMAMQSLLQTLGHAEVHVDVLPQGDDWRVVALPFPRRADAEKGRALLASRGMRVAVVDF